MAADLRAAEWLPAEALAALDRLGPCELLVGVHTMNHARTVAPTLAAWRAGIERAQPEKAALLLVDAGSRDGTVEVALGDASGESGGGIPTLAARLPGLPTRGRALLAILAAARHAGARACVAADGGLVSVAMPWVEALVRPILSGTAEAVLPAYHRAVTDGTLTTNVLAPGVRLLAGRAVHEVVGGCCALSAGLLDRLLGAEGLGEDPTGPGVEMRVVVESLLASPAVVQAALGDKRVDPGATAGDLSRTIVEVVGPLFRLLERHAETWQSDPLGAPVPCLGPAPEVGAPAADTRLDRMVRAFRLGLKDLLPVWEQILTEETLGSLYPLGLLDPDEFILPAHLWARIVANFAVAHHERRLPRDHLLRALTPLYLGRVAAFVRETEAGPPSAVSDVIERVGLAFEAERASLAARWR